MSYVSPSFGPGRLGPPSGSTPAPTETRTLHAPGTPDGVRDNPLVPFAVLAAIAFGLMAFSTTVRVGKTRAAVQIGDTK
ncbi:MAG TPA: hypothetical protein PLB86_07290 [Dermatophilaceae bacterium]|nr:hypothetical protein [Dermatophilaceae bacterium]